MAILITNNNYGYPNANDNVINRADRNNNGINMNGRNNTMVTNMGNRNNNGVITIKIE